MNRPNEQGKAGMAGALAKDARARFAELLRLAELTGQRTRLMRSGKPIAYIVSLDDGERLKRFDEMAKQMGSPPGYPGPGYASPAAMPDTVDSADMPPPLPPDPSPQAARQPNPWIDDSAYPDEADEDERSRAIGVFKKVIIRIMEEKESVSRPEILRRIKDDGYIGTAVRKVIGEGGAR